MSGDIEPSSSLQHEPITANQKALIGSSLASSVRDAVVYVKLSGRDRDYWTFAFVNPELVLDDEGSIPQYMIIAPEGDGEKTRNFRLIIKKNGLHTKIPKTEIYRTAIIKNTELAQEVNKATIRPDHVLATQQDSGMSDDELSQGAIIAAVGLGFTRAEQAYADVMEPEVQAQWELGECSSSEASHLHQLLQQANPSSSSLLDILRGKY